MITATEERHDMAKKAKGQSKVRFHVPLEPYQREALERIQAETGAPIAETIRRAIDRELEARGMKPKGGRR